MSDEKIQDDNVEIPDAAPTDYGSREAKQRIASPAVTFGVAIVGVFTIVTGAIYLSGKEISDPTSSVRTSGDRINATPGGRIQESSPRYQELLEANNTESAEAARQEGRTFIPTPEEILRPIEDLEAGSRIEEEQVPPVVKEGPKQAPEPEPEPETPVVVETPAPPAPPVPPRPNRSTSTEQKENPFKEKILSQMGALSGRDVSSGLSVNSVSRPDTDKPSSPAFAPQRQEAPDAQERAVEVIVPAGDIIYAETLTSTNSDLAGSPVLVELTTGTYRGARLVGSFNVNRASDRMVVEFTSMTFPDGTTFDVSAYAVDGFSAEAAVASDVERRYIKRYGPILASAFISSYANAMSEPDQTITSIGDSVAVIEGSQDAEQSLYAGLGAAANAIGGDLTSNAPTGPKIILGAGYPVAVMFTENVVAD